MAIDIVSLEQKAMAAMTFVVTHASQLDAVRKDIQDILKQISQLKAQQPSK